MKTAAFRLFFFFLLSTNDCFLAILAGQNLNFVEYDWHKGFVLSDEGDSLQGALKIDLTNNAVQVDTGENIKTFTARKILFFKIQDERNKLERLFYSLPYANNSRYESPTFFELIYQGEPVTLLAREKLVTQVVPVSSIYMPMGARSMSRTTVVQEFFLLYIDETDPDNIGIKIKPFTKRAELLDLLKDWRVRLEQFMDDNRLNTENRTHMTEIIEYYNALKQK